MKNYKKKSYHLEVESGIYFCLDGPHLSRSLAVISEERTSKVTFVQKVHDYLAASPTHRRIAFSG